MADTYAAVYTRTQDPVVRNKVMVAIQNAAKYVTSGPPIVLSINQLTNANLAKHNPTQFIDWFIFAVCLDATVQADGATPTDTHVQNVVDAQWPSTWG